MRKYAFLLVLLFLVAPALAVADTATYQLKQSVDAALAILRDPAMQGEENADKRRDALRNTIFQRFDFDKMAQGTVGIKWRQFSPKEREQFIPLFTQVLEKSYLSKIESYNGEGIRFTKETPQGGGRFMKVDSMVSQKGQDFKVSYRLSREGGDWKVFDVIIEGVSLVANYRSQFNQILRTSTPQELILQLEEKLEQEPRGDRFKHATNQVLPPSQ